MFRLPPTWTVTAEFDGPGDCFRYSLVHRWEDGPLVLWGMTNPSGADLLFGDTTVMRTAGIARRLGYGGQIVVNACALRGVNPKMLLAARDPVGPRNLDVIAALASTAGLIVIAHGVLPTPMLQRHAYNMVRVLERHGTLHVLGLTTGGVPKHPLARGRNAMAADVVPHAWREKC